MLLYIIMKKALITGITGQDGSYLAEFLLSKGYEVHGVIRRVSIEDSFSRIRRINHIKDKIILHPGSIESYSRLIEIFDKVQPDECYHLAAQSFVHESFEDSFSTFMINIEGTLNILNALKKRAPNCKFYFAGSSEMFGKVMETTEIAKIKNGEDNVLIIGNLDAKRDWGFAGDYVEAMWLMLQQPEPKDFVIATGETRSVR